MTDRDRLFVCVGCGEPVNDAGYRQCDCATGMIMRWNPREIFLAPDTYEREAEYHRQRAIELDAKAKEVAASVGEAIENARQG